MCLIYIHWQLHVEFGFKEMMSGRDHTGRRVNAMQHMMCILYLVLSL
jgi:hypothetical protein